MKLAALALAALLASPAAALDLSKMSETEKAAFGEQVRAYLLENPEVLAEAIAVLRQREAEEQVADDAALVLANAADIYEDGYSWVGGNPDGNLTIVEFVDYRCSYCKRAHAEVLALLAADDDIRYVVKEFPILGDQSVLAARFAIATLNIAGPEAYQQVHDQFYEGFRGDVTPDTLAAMAEDLVLDTDAILAEMTSPEVTRVIEENHLLAQRLSISGTPTFIMGDQMLRGYVPLDAMQQLVSELRG